MTTFVAGTRLVTGGAPAALAARPLPLAINASRISSTHPEEHMRFTHIAAFSLPMIRNDVSPVRAALPVGV
jgi:hypothetical protein